MELLLRAMVGIHAHPIFLADKPVAAIRVTRFRTRQRDRISISQSISKTSPGPLGLVYKIGIEGSVTKLGPGHQPRSGKHEDPRDLNRVFRSQSVPGRPRRLCFASLLRRFQPSKDRP